MSPELASRHFSALGSTCELLALGVGQAALERCEQRVRQEEVRFTRFVKESELARLNAGDGRYVPVSPEMFAMLEAALWAYEESGGLVNAAILPALRAAGYDRPFGQGLTQPGSSEPMHVPGLPDVLILDGTTRSVALAHLGGDVRVRGNGPEGDGWHIGLCDGSAVAVRDGAVCTSGTTRRRWGQSVHHLIDPKTGMPVRTDLEEVSVITDFALRGEVYAKCAMLLGASAGLAFLESRGVRHAVVPVGKGDGLLPAAV